MNGTTSTAAAAAAAAVTATVVTETAPMTPTPTTRPTTTPTTTTTRTGANSPPVLLRSLRSLRSLLLDLPLCLVVLAWAATHLLDHVYMGPVQTLIESFRRSGDYDDLGYIADVKPDLTYYGRQCDARDISTTDSNDLMVAKDATADQAAHVMMQHGAILVQDILTNATATALRDYLESRNAIRDELDWHEKFWGDIGRLALGLGADDHPIIAQALTEVGQSKTLQTALDGIVGPDPAIVEISTLTALHDCEPQGIHTDSDYFGSSLLYSRTFLHSYTLFMALQDTTSRMGATTICPGTQWCANEDLSDVCYNHGAFEASSNGHTGPDSGVLFKGDGMMFNQNVWHRGPKNYDIDYPINRVMFIVTFVSSRDYNNLQQEQQQEKRQQRNGGNGNGNGDGDGDVRQQGLGTYYYQRWNMWGHTFQDLTSGAMTSMTQPWAALRALGLFKWPGSGTSWGVPWLEHFARQLANEEDFYTDYELEDFVSHLEGLSYLPKFLRPGPHHSPHYDDDDDDDEGTGKRRRRRRRRRNEEEEFDYPTKWEPYLKELLARVKAFVDQIHMGAVGIYLVIHVLMAIVSASVSTSASTRAKAKQQGQPKAAAVYTGSVLPLFLKRFVMIHLMVGAMAVGLWYYITEVSYMGQRIDMRDTWRQPFPKAPVKDDDGSPPDHLTRTTLPTREDILVGSRFDAPYLASFNHVLDYHPGNVALAKAMQVLPTSSTTWIRTFILGQPVQGVTPRFLQQDWQTGYWSLMDETEIQAYLEHELLLRRQEEEEETTTTTTTSTNYGRLRRVDEHLKTVLADARFGRKRDTVMSKRFTPRFVKEWQSILFGGVVGVEDHCASPITNQKMCSATSASTTTTTTKRRALSASTNSKIYKPLGTTVIPFSKVLSSLLLLTPEDAGTVVTTIRVGDHVQAAYFGTGEYWDATVSAIYSEEWVHVEYVRPGNFGDADIISIRNIRPVRRIVQGDVMELVLDEGFEEVTVVLVHPLGTVTIQYEAEDSEVLLIEDVPFEALRYPTAPKVRVVEFESVVLEVGQRVQGNFEGDGRWFHGYITHDNGNGTFGIQYDDGDSESHVPLQLIRTV